MKKVFIILLIVQISYGCSTKEDKAKKIIKKDLSTTMNDFTSYEPIEFGKLDSMITKYDETEFLNNDSLIFYEKSDIPILLKRYKETFKPTFIGYRMSHKFRGKNNLGALIINEYNYYFDPKIEKIIKTENKQALIEKYNKIFDDSIEELKRLKSQE